MFNIVSFDGKSYKPFFYEIIQWWSMVPTSESLEGLGGASRIEPSEHHVVKPPYFQTYWLLSRNIFLFDV